MKKSRFVIMAALVLAAASFSVASVAASPADNPPGAGIVDTVFVKAVAVGCKHNVSGLDNTLDLALAHRAAFDKGVVLTRANYPSLLAGPKANVNDLVPGRVAALNLKPADCPKAIEAMERRMGAIVASLTPPGILND